MTWQNAPELLSGYQCSLKLVLEDYLPNLVLMTESNLQLTDLSYNEQLVILLKPILASKQHGSEHILALLVANACLQVMNQDDTTDFKKYTFLADSVCVVKIIGSSIQHSLLVLGFCAQWGVEMTCTKVEDEPIKIAVFVSGIEASSTKSKGTMLMKSADELKWKNKKCKKILKPLLPWVITSRRIRLSKKSNFLSNFHGKQNASG